MLVEWLIVWAGECFNERQLRGSTAVSAAVFVSDMCQDAAVLLHNSAVSIFYHHYLCSEMRELAKQSPCQACLKSSISK